jgi:hypothetical protein
VLPGGRGTVDQRDWVGLRPAAPDREGEQAVHEGQVVGDCLRRQGRELGVHIRLDVVGVDAVEGALAEMRHEVAEQVAAVVLDRRALALLDRGEVLDVARARLRDGFRSALPMTMAPSCMRRRSSASAWVRVRPSRDPAARLGPSARLTRRPPTRHQPYQVSTPFASGRIASEPLPYERRAIQLTRFAQRPLRQLAWSRTRAARSSSRSPPGGSGGSVRAPRSVCGPGATARRPRTSGRRAARRPRPRIEGVCSYKPC